MSYIILVSSNNSVGTGGAGTLERSVQELPAQGGGEQGEREEVTGVLCVPER